MITDESREITQLKPREPTISLTPNIQPRQTHPVPCPSEPSVKGKSEHQPALSTPLVVQTEFAEIGDGSLVETIEDPDDSSRTLLAVYKEGEVSYTSRLQFGDRVLVPIPRNEHIVKYVCLPRGAKPCESAYSLVQRIYSIFSQCLDLNEEYRTLLGFFVLSTWFIDLLPVAPYVAFVGLPRSGKSTALKLLGLLCRRALLTADITSAAFYRVCERLTPTLLIDETGTAGEKRVLFHLLRTGTNRDFVAIRKQECFTTFGSKAISWIELPNDAALNSRCLVIPLHETHRTDLKRPWDPEIVQAADELRKQLLQLRLENYKKLNLPKIQGDEKLHSRTRDLYEALALSSGGDPSMCQWLLSSLKLQQESNREPLTPIQSAVLWMLFMCIHLRQFNDRCQFYIQILTNKVNLMLQSDGEGLRVSARGVGAALTSLGFTRRKSTNKGRMVWFDREARTQIHDLVADYGIHRPHYLQPEEAMVECKLCEDRKGLITIPTSEM